MLEIERKYLLSGLPDIPAEVVPLEIEQGYFMDEVGRLIRVRRTQASDGSVQFHQSHKSGQGLIREEFEESVDAAVFHANWPRTLGKRVRKSRYPVLFQGFTWEVDVFSDRDLVLAEVELSEPDEDPPMPPWLERFIVREVTEEAEFTNYRLAR